MHRFNILVFLHISSQTGFVIFLGVCPSYKFSRFYSWELRCKDNKIINLCILYHTDFRSCNCVYLFKETGNILPCRIQIFNIQTHDLMLFSKVGPKRMKSIDLKMFDDKCCLCRAA